MQSGLRYCARSSEGFHQQKQHLASQNELTSQLILARVSGSRGLGLLEFSVSIPGSNCFCKNDFQ